MVIVKVVDVEDVEVVVVTVVLVSVLVVVVTDVVDEVVDDIVDVVVVTRVEVVVVSVEVVFIRDTYRYQSSADTEEEFSISKKSDLFASLVCVVLVVLVDELTVVADVVPSVAAVLVVPPSTPGP